MEHRWKVLLLISSGSFMAFLDAPVVSVAFPEIGRSFPDASSTALAWVLDGYFIGFAAFLLVAGRLADRIGRRRMFIAGVWVFTLASLACAVAPSVEFLVGARIVQALGAAAVVPAGQGLMLAEFPVGERKTAIGVLAAIIGLGTALAPAFGGVIVGWLGWEWIFWVNLVGGGAVILWAMSLLVHDKGEPGTPMPDALGAVCQAAALALLVLGILKVPDWGWGDTRTVLALPSRRWHWWCSSGARAVVGAPVLDFKLFRDRTIRAANLASLVFAIGFYGTIIIAVLFLSNVWGYSTLETGLAFVPGAIFSAGFGRPAGKFADRVGPRPVAVVGGVMAGAGLLLITISVGPEPNFVRDWLPGALLYSAGLVVALTGMVGGAVTGAPAPQFAQASGANAAIRQVGGAIGVALMLAITTNATPATLNDLAHDAFWVAVAALFAGGVVALGMGSGTQAGVEAGEGGSARRSRSDPRSARRGQDRPSSRRQTHPVGPRGSEPPARPCRNRRR